jgi:hypothetical protein
MASEGGNGSVQDTPTPNTKAKDTMKATDDQAAEGSKSQEESKTSNTSAPESREGTPPPLPPRPSLLQTPNQRPRTSAGQLTLPRSSSQQRSASRPPLQSQATTAVSLADVHSQSHGGEESYPPTPTSRHIGFAGLRLGSSRRGSDGEDTASVMSFAPTLEAGLEVESMMGDVLQDRNTPGRMPITPRKDFSEGSLFPLDPDFEDAFEHEFDELDDVTSDGLNEGELFRMQERYND